MFYQSYSNILIKHRQSANFEPDALNSFLDIYLYSGLSFEVHNSFLPQLTWKWRAIKVQSPKEVSLKGAFYYINHHNLGNSFGLRTLMARHFQAS